MMAEGLEVGDGLRNHKLLRINWEVESHKAGRHKMNTIAQESHEWPSGRSPSHALVRMNEDAHP